ncbi:MAG TPA: glycosyltransferase family 4 protein [Armatimonadota bacterium]|nr:glycosyltransferase family 4 protein [Armatimonadota bacterium]
MAGSALRIAMVRISRTVRGAETHVLALSSAMVARGHEVILVTRPASPMVDWGHERGLEVAELPISGDLNPAASGHMARFLRSGGFDVVHAHGAHGVLGCCLGCRRARVPVVVSFHTPIFSDTPALARFAPRPLRRWAHPSLLRADHIIAVSETSRRYLLAHGFAPERLTTVRNGIEAQRFTRLDRAAARAELGIAEDTIVFLFLARMIPEKRPDWVLGAARELRGEPRIRFLMAGEGPLLGATITHIQEADMRDRVTLLGFRQDTAPLLAAADCLVAPSTREGLPIAFLEAMAAGCPVIATHVGGVPELVVHGESGLLVPPDDFGAFASAVRRMAEDGELRRRLAANARERIARYFTAEANAAAVEGVLRRAIAGRATPAARSAR